MFYDRMKTAAIREDAAGVVTCDASLAALPAHCGPAPRACRPYRTKTKAKAKVERPFSFVRRDVFPGRSFRDLDDLNAQFAQWRATIATQRVHAAAHRVIDEPSTEEQPYLAPLPARPYDAVLTVKRRISQEGMAAVGGDRYSVPDTTRRRIVEVRNHRTEVRIFEDGLSIAGRPVPEGKSRKRVVSSRRKPVPVARRTAIERPSPADAAVLRRPPAFGEAVGRRLANQPEGRQCLRSRAASAGARSAEPSRRSTRSSAAWKGAE